MAVDIRAIGRVGSGGNRSVAQIPFCDLDLLELGEEAVVFFFLLFFDAGARCGIAVARGMIIFGGVMVWAGVFVPVWTVRETGRHPVLIRPWTAVGPFGTEFSGCLMGDDGGTVSNPSWKDQ